MALNFPSAPNVNATYTFSDKTWTYNGNAWTLSYGTLNTGVVSEGSNLYFTNARVYANVTQIGYITSSSLTGYATNAQLSSFATTANSLSQFASTTSLQLATLISDETGSGALVFATSPTLVTPALGTPSSGTLTNCTFPTLNQNTSGTAAGLSTTLVIGSGGTGNTVGYASGGAASAATSTVSDDTSTNSTHYIKFSASTSGNVAAKVSSTKSPGLECLSRRSDIKPNGFCVG